MYIFIKNSPLLFMEKDALEEFKDIKTENENAIVIGLAPSNFHYDKVKKNITTIGIFFA